MRSFESYWEGKRSSGHRYNGENFYKEKAKEHLLLFKEIEKEMRISDIGCGAGELLYYLVERCHVVDAVDYSSSMITQAKKRLHHKGLEFIISDAHSYMKQSKSQVIVGCESFNQYLDSKEIEEIIDLFVASSHMRSIFLFDTIDPDRYQLWSQGRIRYDHFFPSRKAILMLYLREIWSLFDGGYRDYGIKIGEMGYGYRPHFWMDLAKKHHLKLEIISSLKYEYRYHVVLRK
jgi:SAM-dependent methyltransferase